MKAHLYNCTWCIHRISSKRIKNEPEIERCKLDMHLLPHPMKPGRCCEHFHQEGHDCYSCLPNDSQP